MTITRRNQEGVVFQSNLGITQAIVDPTPSVYTLTYSTGAKTLSTATAAAVVTTGSSQSTPYGYTTSAQADAIPVAINALEADVLVLRQILAQLITDLANLGEVQVA